MRVVWLTSLRLIRIVDVMISLILQKKFLLLIDEKAVDTDAREGNFLPCAVLLAADGVAGTDELRIHGQALVEHVEHALLALFSLDKNAVGLFAVN